jgi:hypothetical protein
MKSTPNPITMQQYSTLEYSVKEEYFLFSQQEDSNFPCFFSSKSAVSLTTYELDSLGGQFGHAG